MSKTNGLIYSVIKERIRNDTKDLPPHSRLPARVKLMERYQVAMSSIEKAVAELVGEGYLYAKDGSGTYIAEPAAENVLEKGVKWGVILPDIVSDTYPEILRGIEDYAQDNGISTILCNTDHDVVKQNRYIRNLVNVGVSGVVIVPAISDKSQTEYLNLLKAHGIPFVFCNRSITGVKAPQVITNNFYGMSMIARHLIRLGYRKIGFISAMYYIAVEQRYQAYLTVLAEHGIPIREEYIYIGVAEQSVEENGYQGAKTLLQSEDRPEAIICFNDRVAIGAYRAASELGLVIGKDIGITGYDDIKACEQIPVQLTTVRFPKYAVGKTAAELLHKMMMGEPVRQDKTIILQPEIVVRQSCGTQNAARK